MCAEDVGGRSLDVFNAGAIGQIWGPFGLGSDHSNNVVKGLLSIDQ
jgi:hypothetical protein